MQIYLGPFHPSLEETFVSEVRRLKSSDPLLPLLVLVPSNRIRQRLKVVLSLENRLSLLNFSILTFHQLSIKLCEEVKIFDLAVQDDIVFEEALRLLIQQSETPSPFLHGLEETEGGSAALWQTLRDLKDGGVTPDVAIEALKEGQFGKQALKKLSSLFELYHRLLDRLKERSLFGYGDLAVLATQGITSSDYLKEFGGIYYYGFYDLTQVQIDLFHALARHYETSLFFPLVRKHSGWDFSNRFFERHVEGLVTDSSQIVDLTSDQSVSDGACAKRSAFINLFEGDPSTQGRKKPSCMIVSCFETRDEVLTAAKEIIKLVEDEGASFHEIALVARDIDSNQSLVKEIFEKHAIPITTDSQASLLQFPLAKYVVLFMNLRLRDYPRSHCIDLVTSPYFDAVAFCPEGLVPERDQWDLLSRRAGINKGIESWKGLAEGGGGVKSEHRQSIPNQGTLLLKIVESVYEDLNRLPSAASWSDYAARYQNLLGKYLGLESTGENEGLWTQEDPIKKKISALFDSISTLDKLMPSIAHRQFVETFERWISRATIPMTDSNIAGVSVLSASSARGLSFRFLFLLGMNEGSFPRSIREDPFLADRHRRVIETDLGYKVGEKLAGYDEERLLLSLLVDATQEKLFAMYHRVDAEGGAVSQSWYLNCLRLTLRLNDVPPEERIIPRSIQSRRSVVPYNRFDLLMPSEGVLRNALAKFDVKPLISLLPFPSTLFHHGRSVIRQLESGGRLTAFDGLTGALSDSPSSTKKTGMTPTRLERYALCPFRYFAIDLLKLRPIELPEDQSALAMSDIGTLCHAILKDFYSGLHRDGYFRYEKKETRLLQDLKAVSHTCFRQYELEQGPAYPLLWEEIKEQLVRMLYQVILIDLEFLRTSGFQPVAFEVSCKGRVEALWPEMTGRLDRIDFHLEKKQVRVVDYKFTFRKQAKPNEKNLAVSAVRGIGLQAPLYQKLAEEFGDEGFPVRSVFYFLAPNWPDGPLVMRDFPEDGWEGQGGTLLKETISSLLAGMEDGHFFINPGDHCAYCDVAALCRKEHIPSRRRLEQDPLSEAHRLLRKKKWPTKAKETD